MQLVIPPLQAETIFNIGSFPVTNSYINTLIATGVFIILAIVIQKGIKKYYSSNNAPKGFLNFFEAIVEFMFGYLDQVTADRKKSLKFLPLIGGFFFFILFANWLGLMPGTGSIGRCVDHHAGTYVAYEMCLKGDEAYHVYPLLRPSNTDLNMTLAMAVLAVAASHLFGIAAIGFFKYANKFVKLGDLYKAFASLNPIKILTAIVEFFVGLIEIFSEVAKMVSLSLRLYGNIFAGEVLLTVLASLIAVFVPLPFIALEILVGLIQATVFSMLTLVYFNMATMEHGGHGEEGSAHTVSDKHESIQTPTA